MSDVPQLRVLVVEDDPDTRENLCDVLSLDGHLFETAASAGEALAKVARCGFHVILLDWRLPDASAETLLPQLRQRAPDVAVIVSTGVGGVDQAITALRHGAADYIAKPVDSDLLRASLRRVADRLRLKEKLLQSERLAAIGQAMTGLAHESRNALQRGQADLELLGLIVADNPEASALVRRLDRVQQELHRLYEEVRQYAAPLTLLLERHDVGQIAREAWELLARIRGGKDATLEIAPRDECHWRIDRFQMLNVFRNLFENSLSAASGPVRVVVRFQRCQVDNVPWLAIHVSDNGPGIAPEVGEAAFEAFVTTKTRGTGLGLAIVRRIVEAHHGQIRFGRPHQGAEVVIEMPAS